MFFLSIISINYFLIINLIFLILSYFCVPKKILNDLNFSEKIYLFHLSPIIGFNFLFGGISGFVFGLLLEIYRKIINIIDYLKILFKVIIRNGNPIQIVNFITARCNLRCNHCL